MCGTSIYITYSTYILHHDPTIFCLSLVKREPTQLCPAELKLEAKKNLYFCCISIYRTSIQSLQLEMSAHFQANLHHHLESPLRLCSFLAWALCFVLYTNHNYVSTNLLYLGFFFGASEQLRTACLPSSVSHRQASVQNGLFFLLYLLLNLKKKKGTCWAGLNCKVTCVGFGLHKWKCVRENGCVNTKFKFVVNSLFLINHCCIWFFVLWVFE